MATLKGARALTLRLQAARLLGDLQRCGLVFAAVALLLLLSGLGRIGGM
jgi:hypothetical protein